MTFDEVRRHIDEGGVIRCENVYQREEAVKFLVDIGFELLPAAARWLEKNRTDASFLHPGLDDDEPKITCWRTASDKQEISFGDIEALIAQTDDDYWTATEGNAKRPLLQLLAMAKMRPDGIWNGD